MQISGEAVMGESEIEGIFGAEHSASPNGQLALSASNSLLGKSNLTSSHSSNNPEDDKGGLPVNVMLSQRNFLLRIYLG